MRAEPDFREGQWRGPASGTELQSPDDRMKSTEETCWQLQPKLGRDRTCARFDALHLFVQIIEDG